MRHVEIRKCRKCGAPYSWECGGIVASPRDYADRGLCPKCRHIENIGSIFKIFKK